MAAPNHPNDMRLSADCGGPSQIFPLPAATGKADSSFARLVRRKTMQQIFARAGARGFLVSMLLGSALISALSLPYFDFETVPPFVLEKLPLRFEALWLAALRVHVAAAALAFPLCLALMTRALQRRARLHRWLGRIAGTLVLFALVPSGSVLALAAKGGRIVSAGFLLSGAIVAAAMVLGVRAARRRDLATHARAMRHVIGQMSVAVVSRALLVALDALGVDPEIAYVWALWVPVLASAAAVEWISRRSLWHRSPLRLIERIRGESSSLALIVRIRALFRAFARDGR